MNPINLFENDQIVHQEENNCLICFENIILQNNNNHTIQECNHTFHSSCLIEWFRTGNSNCPTCRNDGARRNYRRSGHILNWILRYSKRKNASKKVISLVNKYKKLKMDYANVKQERINYQKENKDVLKGLSKLRQKCWKYGRKLRDVKNEIVSIPIQPLK